jgi:hypothetical protein
VQLKNEQAIDKFLEENQGLMSDLSKGEAYEQGLCACRAESTRGCHGLREGRIYSEYFCDDCYNRKEAQ